MIVSKYCMCRDLSMANGWIGRPAKVGKGRVGIKNRTLGADCHFILVSRWLMLSARSLRDGQVWITFLLDSGLKSQTRDF
jgi:hypothetical protein